MGQDPSFVAEVSLLYRVIPFYFFSFSNLVLLLSVFMSYPHLLTGNIQKTCW